MSASKYRLPGHIRPINYDIDIDASPQRETFSGKLTLSVQVHEPCSTIEMHARDLSITNVRLDTEQKRLDATVREHAERQTIELALEDEIPKGSAQLRLEFCGKLNESMHGLYLARDGADKAVVSQCEATDARAIFPCFDEPEYKATFRWTVRTDPGLEVITNGLPESRSNVEGQAVHTFRPTELISTYVLALTIGELEGSETRSVAGTPSRIWCVPGKVAQTAFAEEVTQKVLPWFQDYFDEEYAFKKLDQVAVPGFDAGAMENVGAVFYRQSLLLMQPETTSWESQKRIAEVVAHELAHMWFGNLVTMRWWDDLWLNEAFATWMAYKAIDEWKPEWRMWDDALAGFHAAMSADALLNTHPVYSQVNSPAEATELFDVITYEKGCAVLRMVERYLGDLSFKNGIRSYISKFKSGNATGSDLWTELGEAAGEPVHELMQSWITQPGFPLLSVSASTRGGKSRLLLRQRRFFADSSRAEEPNEQKWRIPLVVRYGDGERSGVQRFVMTEKEQVLNLPDSPRVRWCYPNADAAGFFRLHLDDKLLRGVVELGLDQLRPPERTGLVDDSWALVLNGQASVERFMQILVALREERDHVVVRAMAARIAYLDNYLVSAEDRPILARLVRWLLGPQLSELGWSSRPSERPDRSTRRATVIWSLGAHGRDPEVHEHARSLVEKEMQDPAAVSAELAGVIVQLAALAGDQSLLDRYASTYRSRREHRMSPEVIGRYLNALGRFERKGVVKQVLGFCLDGTIPQDQLRAVLSPLLINRLTGRAAWTFLKKHWAKLAPRVGNMGIARLVETTGAIPVDLRDDVEAFFAENPVPQAQRAVGKALEAMDLRRGLVERERPALSEWLRRSVPELESGVSE